MTSIEPRFLFHPPHILVAIPTLGGC